MYLVLKYGHVGLAALTLGGFLLRGLWMLTGSQWRSHPASKIAPHALDTLFLGSGIALLVLLHMNPLQQAWLVGKFAGLLAYIGFGMLAFRFGRTSGIRLAAFVAAIASFAYVVGAALTKSPFSWLAY